MLYRMQLIQIQCLLVIEISIWKLIREDLFHGHRPLSLGGIKKDLNQSWGIEADKIH